MSDHALTQCPLFADMPGHSEVHDLFRWKNGIHDDSQVPMGQLWFIPGHYLVSAQEAFSLNKYMAEHPLSSWAPTWFPLLKSGSADFHFFDKAHLIKDRVPVFYSDTEFPPGLWQIYDSIESMFRTIFECYSEGVYFLSADGWLDCDARREAAISKQLNPDSEHWCRTDLF
jgi:hypothetical protein